MKARVKKILNLAGVDIRLCRNIARAEEQRKLEEWRRTWHALGSHLSVRTVIDVGANEGQFAQMIKGVFPGCPVLSFEPLPHCRSALEKVLQDIPGSQLYDIALGDASGVIELRQTSFSPCSSMLVPNERLKREVTSLEEIDLLKVQVSRLDDVLKPLSLTPPLLIKLDVQGYESKVLAGATRALSLASAVVLEVSFVPLYEGQPLFDDIYQVMREHGFSYRGNLSQNVSRLDGVIVEADALFVKSACLHPVDLGS